MELKIKALEWKTFEDLQNPEDYAYAETPFGIYSASKHINGSICNFSFGAGNLYIYNKKGASLNDAKSAAEADWNTKLLKCFIDRTAK